MNLLRLFQLLGGRKLVITLILLVLGTVMQYTGKFDSNMTTFFLGLGGIFVAGNAVSKLANKQISREQDQ